ncbi:MAG: hypothetical protein ACYTBJ_05340 [Planctomycetota bacterium]|jgi:hypothetical protein
MSWFFHGFSDELLKLAFEQGKYGIKIFGNWHKEELNALYAILTKLPKRLVRGNRALRAVGRAPKLINGPPHAPGHSMYKPDKPEHGKYRGTLVIFDKGVYDASGKIDPVLFGKSVLHELSHSFDDNVPDVFGRPPFITEYAGTSAKEDWAESFAEYFLHPGLLKRKTPEKSRAIAAFVGGRS